MRAEDNIVQALGALAEADRQVEAPPELETRVRQAFRRRQRRGNWNRGLWAAGVAAAAAIAILVWLHPLQKTRQKMSPAIAVSARPVVQPTAPVIAAVDGVRPRRTETRRRQVREIVTEFFPLIDAAPPIERGELVRVDVPASTMRTVGLPVAEDRLTDRVRADVLVSEDGLATAIRFVKYE